MGGGPAMRVAGKNGGVVNGTIRGGFPAFPENITSSAFKANATRPITGVISSGDWEVAEEVARSVVVGQPLPRVVFGGAPTLEEAQDATFQLRSALDQVYLSNESSEISCESDMGQDKLAISDSGHFESKARVTKASAPNRAIRAFQLLKESPAAQAVVVSIARDPNLWTAVMKNEAFLEYLRSQYTGMNGCLEDSTADTGIPGYQYPKYSDDQTFNMKEPEKGFRSFLKGIKSRVEDMMNSFSSVIHYLFAGPATPGESANVEKIMGASIVGLAVMVIMIVVFKRV